MTQGICNLSLYPFIIFRKRLKYKTLLLDAFIFLIKYSKEMYWRWLVGKKYCPSKYTVQSVFCVGALVWSLLYMTCSYFLY